MNAPAWMFDVRGLGSETVEIDVMDVIGESMFVRGVTAKEVRARLRDAGNAKSIKVKINSRGGDVVEGLAIHNLLAEHAADVDVEIVGLAASMAGVIAMAGTTITMAAGSFFMLHNPWGMAVGESEDLRSHADLLDKMRDTLVSIYSGRTGQKPSDVRKMMDAETWLKADEAKAKGFADRVVKQKRSHQKAAASAFAAIDPDTYANLPEELRAVASATTSPPPREETEEPETEPMALPVAILLALGLNEGANDAAAVSAITSLKTERDTASARLKKLEAAIGKSGEEAHGAVVAYKASHEKLPALEKQVNETRAAAERGELEALLKKGREDKKLSKAEAEKLKAQVESYWAAKAKGEDPPEDALSLGAAKSFVAVMSPKEYLAASPEPSAPSAGVQEGALTHGGKKFEDMTPNEWVSLAKSSPELYENLRADAQKRGAI